MRDMDCGHEISSQLKVYKVQQRRAEWAGDGSSLKLREHNFVQAELVFFFSAHGNNTDSKVNYRLKIKCMKIAKNRFIYISQKH